MMQTTLKDYIERHLNELGDPIDVEFDDDLVSMGFDSVGYVRLLNFITTEFGVNVPDTDVTVEQFGSIGAIASYLEGRLAATGSATE